MDYNVEFVGNSQEEHNSILEYLSQFYASTVQKYLTAFDKCLTFLSENPYIYQAYEPAPQYRRAIVGDYLVFYKIFDPVDNQSGLVEIYNILHSSWNIERIIKSEDTQ